MSREVEVHVPDIGDFDAVDVVEILVAPGDRVAVEDPLVSLESDKATMEVPSPVAGEVLSVKVSLGDAVSEGSLLVVVAATDEAPAPKPTNAMSMPAEPVAAPASAVPSSPAPIAAESTAATSPPLARFAHPSMPSVPFAGGRGVDRPVRAHAGPGIRRQARELGVDLAQVDGSGSAGRVLEGDLKAYVRESFERGGPSSTAVAVQPGRNADVTDLETWRRRIPVPDGEAPPSTLAVVLKALVGALRAFPELTGDAAAGVPLTIALQPSGDGEAVVVDDAASLGLRALAAALEQRGGAAPATVRLHHALHEPAQRPTPVRGERERLAVAVGALEVVPRWTGSTDDAIDPAGDAAAHFEPRVIVPLQVALAPDLAPELAPRFLDHWAEILGAPARLLL